MSGESSSGGAVVGMGLLFAFIGALAGNKANGGSGAVAGAVAGFAVGVAFARMVQWAALFAIAGIGLFLAYLAFQGAMTRVEKVTGTSDAAALALPLWFRNECPRGDCQDFRVRAGIVGKKETQYVPTQRACDTG